MVKGIQRTVYPPNILMLMNKVLSYQRLWLLRLRIERYLRDAPVE